MTVIKAGANMSLQLYMTIYFHVGDALWRGLSTVIEPPAFQPKDGCSDEQILKISPFFRSQNQTVIRHAARPQLNESFANATCTRNGDEPTLNEPVKIKKSVPAIVST